MISPETVDISGNFRFIKIANIQLFLFALEIYGNLRKFTSGVIKKSTAHHDEKTPRCHQLEIYLPTSVIVSSSQLRGHSN
jgi:hypothetical protein